MKHHVVLRASTRGARRAGHALRSTARELQVIMLEEFRRNVAPGAQKIFRRHAPRSRLARIKPDAPGRRSGRSGDLARGMEAKVRSYGGRITAEVHSTARSERGYDYLDVTRFGHRVAILQPKRAKALAIPVQGGVIFRRFVRGYRPARDWAEAAFEESEALLDEAAERIGRKIDRRLMT